MPKGQRFPLEVMLRAMREVNGGVPVGVVCRKIGMVEKTFYRRLRRLLTAAEKVLARFCRDRC